jgi:hypothetical protein
VSALDPITHPCVATVASVKDFEFPFPEPSLVSVSPEKPCEQCQEPFYRHKSVEYRRRSGEVIGRVPLD